MDTKWKIILLVMLIIVTVCSVLITLFVFDSRENLQTFVKREITSIRAIVTTTEEENSRYYRNRIKAFISHLEVPKQEQLISTFARRDRYGLLRLSTPYFKFFKKENPYFATFGWITPDNYAFLRVHQPTQFGDSIDLIRPDVVMSNKEKRQIIGYIVPKSGPQFCIVQPVSYAGRHVGIVHFGLKINLLLDAVHKKLNIPVGIVIPNDKFAVITHSELPSLGGNTHTIQSNQIDLFQQDGLEIDWSLEQQKVTLQGKTHIIVNAFNLLNYKQEPQGAIFVALDISGQEQKLQSKISLIILISGLMLVLSFITLFKSYGSLVDKITTLNHSLKQNNLELETRVQERTAKLQESEKRLQKILNEAPLGILIADPQTMSFQYANPAICKMLGYDKEELENMEVQLVHTSTDFDRVRKEFEAQSQGRKRLATDIPFLCKDGTSIDTDVIVSIIELDGRPCTVGFIVDQTERRIAKEQRRELESQLLQKHKMEAVGLMAGGMAHNFNNNLAIILGNVELAQLKQTQNSETVPLLENAKIAVLRSRDLIRQIMIYSRQKKQDKAPIELPQVVDETLRLIRSTLPATVNLLQSISTNSSNLTINANANQIQECLINLCNNAMHAMEEKGNMTVSLKAVDLLAQDIPPQYEGLPGHYVKLSVQDDGSGMPPEAIEKIFDPFFTTKAVGEGTGMGLSTVQGIVNEHSGLIKVTSEPGKGTTFDLYFPVIERRKQELAPADNDLPKGNEKVLVVDDEKMLADVLKAMLTEHGYQVSTMTDSVAALKMFTGNPDHFDLVITDQTMPELTGKELIQELHKIRPDLPTIFCTGHGSKINEDEAKELGINAFCMKPLDLSELLQAVRQALDKG